MNKHSVSIVLPYYGQWQLTHSCLMSLYNFLPQNCEVILVNDASPDLDCKTGAGWWQKNMAGKFPIKYVENEINLGFGGAHNRGATFASGDILVFLSNDVIIKGDFVTPIINVINEYNSEILIGGEVLRYDTGWNTLIINGKTSIVPYPNGWLIACTKFLWERIGGWDVENYKKFDYEDIDLGAWAIYNDVLMIGLNLSFLKHIGGATIYPLHPNRQEFTNQNRKAFIEKWTKKLEEKFSG